MPSAFIQVQMSKLSPKAAGLNQGSFSDGPMVTRLAVVSTILLYGFWERILFTSSGHVFTWSQIALSMRGITWSWWWITSKQACGLSPNKDTYISRPLRGPNQSLIERCKLDAPRYKNTTAQASPAKNKGNPKTVKWYFLRTIPKRIIATAANMQKPAPMSQNTIVIELKDKQFPVTSTIFRKAVRAPDLVCLRSKFSSTASKCNID